MYGICKMDRRQRGEAKMTAKKISYLFDWNNLISAYDNAYGKLVE